MLPLSSAVGNVGVAGGLLIAFYLLPSEHWTELGSTNLLERFNKEIGRHTDVVGVFPNDAAIISSATLARC